ncbi:MAG: nucleoside recognition protein [Deltaproteobacteria bacterium]
MTISDPPHPPEDPTHPKTGPIHHRASSPGPTARKRLWPPFFVSLAVTLATSAFLFQAPDINAPFIWKRIVWPLIRLLGVVTLTLGLTSLVEALGWSRFVSGLFRPLLKIGHFSAASSFAYTTAFLSGISANTILAKAWQEGAIDRRELTLSNLLNIGLPSFVLHLPPMLAIIVPFVGKAGLIYAGVMFAAAVMRTLFVLALARSTLTNPHNPPEPAPSARPDRDTRSSDILASLAHRLFQIGTYTVPIYTLVVTLDRHGFFRWLQESAATIVTSEFIPVEGISVVVFSIVLEFTAGAAAAGAMLESGVLTTSQTVLALLAGNVIATPIRTLRHQLPGYLGIFSPGLGMKLLLYGQILRVVSVILSGGLYYLL